MDEIDIDDILEQAVSVSGLTGYLKSLIEYNGHLQQVWLVGEVSSASSHPTGIFFTLQDKQASVKCIVWNNYREKLRQMPVVGEQVVVLGSVRLYPQKSEYNLHVAQVFLAGNGLRALRYRQLKGRLEAEGLFHPQRKRPLPPHPQTVAVVTAPQGAAWGDIQRTLMQRYPGLRVLLSPATVQGRQAAGSIASAIARVQRDGRAEVVILARGGGASEDLECFNDERVVRAIATCTIPIIAGIGHQRDETLADLAADAVAHTPTAAAQMAVPTLASLYQQHSDRVAALHTAVERRFLYIRSHLERLRQRLEKLPQTSVSLQRAKQKCQLLRQQLAAIDPNAVLQRGYAVVRLPDGAIVRQASTITPGQKLLIRFGDGQAKVIVTEIITPSQPPTSK
ncbi:MAG: exodeoxyribonuclease VII large subunit [Oscillatoriaceae cyanobacterium]